MTLKQAIEIVLDLARGNLIEGDPELIEELERQLKACDVLESFVVHLTR